MIIDLTVPTPIAPRFFRDVQPNALFVDEVGDLMLKIDFVTAVVLVDSTKSNSRIDTRIVKPEPLWPIQRTLDIKDIKY